VNGPEQIILHWNFSGEADSYGSKSLILILPRLFQLQGVEMCQAISDLLAFLISVPVVRMTFKEMDIQTQNMHHNTTIS